MEQCRPILLIEDSRDDILLIREALKASDTRLELVVILDGAEALDYLFRRGVYRGRDPAIEPQLVIVNLKLPKLDGFEVLRSIRQDRRTESLPVLALTTGDSESELIEIDRIGANGHVLKSADFSGLVDAVERFKVN